MWTSYNGGHKEQTGRFQQQTETCHVSWGAVTQICHFFLSLTVSLDYLCTPVSFIPRSILCTVNLMFHNLKWWSNPIYFFIKNQSNRLPATADSTSLLPYLIRMTYQMNELFKGLMTTSVGEKIIILKLKNKWKVASSWHPAFRK